MRRACAAPRHQVRPARAAIRAPRSRRPWRWPPRCRIWRWPRRWSWACPRRQPGLLFGKGKIEELKQRIEALEVGLVLGRRAGHAGAAAQPGKGMGVKLLDRTGLILEIFADRAATREGVLQVELGGAQLPAHAAGARLDPPGAAARRARLRRRPRRGTQIRGRQRAIDEAVTRIRRQLARVVKTRALHRKARKKVPYPIVALVGYTNAGTSTSVQPLDRGGGDWPMDLLFARSTRRCGLVALHDGTVPVPTREGFIFGPADATGRRLPRHAGGGAGRRSDRACARQSRTPRPRSRRAMS